MVKLYRGPFSGSIIHTARVAGRCAHVDQGDRCGKLISPGDEYVYGALKIGSRVPEERVRICMDCACGEARGGVSMGAGA